MAFPAVIIFVLVPLRRAGGLPACAAGLTRVPLNVLDLTHTQNLLHDVVGWWPQSAGSMKIAAVITRVALHSIINQL